MGASARESAVVVRGLPASRNELGRPGHLYVADLVAGMIYRFPLARDGLPATTPDLVLQGGLHEPYGLAVDPSGNLYVSDFDLGTVSVYAPGASGSTQPIRQLSLDGDTPYALAINPQGYEFVDDLDTNTINVYLPGADGFDPPIHQIAIWAQSNPIQDFVIDRSGRLYVRAFDPGVSVFYDPVNQWQHADGLLLPTGGYEFAFNSALALDDPHRELYINFGPQNPRAPFGKDDFAVRRLDLAVGKDHLILTRNCQGSSGSQGNDVAAAVSGEYLMFSCAENFNAVLVYRARDYGKEPLVESIGFGLFEAVAGIALGP
jgi:hypothetical protein